MAARSFRKSPARTATRNGMTFTNSQLSRQRTAKQSPRLQSRKREKRTKTSEGRNTVAKKTKKIAKQPVEQLHECQNCGKKFTEDKLADYSGGFWERVSPGEIMPSGQCPSCGALCHPVVEESKKPYVLITVSGGTAYLAKNDGNIDVDILDFDNLKDATPETIFLSDMEWDYLKKFEPTTYKRLGGKNAKQK